MDRAAYVDKMEARLRQWDAEIRRVEGEADEATEPERADAQHHARSLRAQWNDAMQGLEEIRESPDDAWQEARSFVEQAMARMRDGLSARATRSWSATPRR